MKPYYADGKVTLYHGDCRDILAGLPVFDLVIADPPYQSLDVEVSNGTTTRLVRRDALGGKRLASLERGSWFATLSAADILAVLALTRDLLSDSGALYVFADVKSGLALFPALAPANVLVWDKKKLGMGYNWRRMHEWIAYCPQAKHELRSDARGDIVRAKGVQSKRHATEKPADVLSPLVLNSSDEDALILDPFCGSGSTLFAAKCLNRRAIGIEIEERYCEIAAQRCSQEVLEMGA